MSQFPRGQNRGVVFALGGAAFLGAAQVMYYQSPRRRPAATTAGNASPDKTRGSPNSSAARAKAGNDESRALSSQVGAIEQPQAETNSNTQTVASSNLPREDVQTKRGHWCRAEEGTLATIRLT